MGGRIGSKVARRGAIGQQIFEQAEQLTAQGGMTRLAAFNQIAKASGRQPGTVAANYYRVARQRGVALRPRRPRSGSPGASSRIADAVKLVQQLLGRQAEEIQRLQKDTVQLTTLRRMLRQ